MRVQQRQIRFSFVLGKPYSLEFFDDALHNASNDDNSAEKINNYCNCLQ
jgi:hypothetical protein